MASLISNSDQIMYADPELVERTEGRIYAAFAPLQEAAVEAMVGSEPSLGAIHAARRECLEIARDALLEAERKGDEAA